MIRRLYLYISPEGRRRGRKISYGYIDWPSYSVWIIPGTIDLLA